jgi:hypothetical protein
VHLEDQRSFDTQGDKRNEDRDSDRQTLGCWSHHAIVTHHDGIDVPPTAGDDAALQQSVDDVEAQGGCVEDEDVRASLVVLGEQKQYEEEDQASTELDSWNDAVDNSIFDQSVDIPQWKLGLLAVAISDGEILVVHG